MRVAVSRSSRWSQPVRRRSRRYGMVEGKNPARSSRHGGRRSHGPQYKAGDPVPQSGIYEVIHARAHRETHEVVMLAGDLFPPCDTCDEQVRFHLVRTAPYIFQDEDFETQD